MKKKVTVNGEAKMPTILKTPEGRKVIVDILHDECLYESPHNSPNTGTRCTSGTDLYIHKARSGTLYYYSHTWSILPGNVDEFCLVTADEMKSALIDRASGYGDPSQQELDRAENHFPGTFGEDA